EPHNRAWLSALHPVRVGQGRPAGASQPGCCGTAGTRALHSPTEAPAPRSPHRDRGPTFSDLLGGRQHGEPSKARSRWHQTATVLEGPNRVSLQHWLAKRIAIFA